MTHYGKITHFDKDTGTGMISATDGGGALPFMASGMREEPRSDQTYRFETETNPDGRLHAVNLTMDDSANARQPGSSASGGEGTFDPQGQSENRHNQDAERRSGVDGAGVNGAGWGGTGGSDAYRPGTDSHGQGRGDDPTEHQTRTAGQEGVSRGGQETARGDAPGQTRATTGGTSAGGSTFQPLEAEESKAERSPERQHDLGRDSHGRDDRA
jgi:cold shock CspA family protein